MEAPAPPPGPPRSKAVWIIAGAIVLAGAMVAGAVIFLSRTSKSSVEPKPAETFTLMGTLEAPECGGGYDLEFASVNVRDQNDKLIGSGSTGPNQLRSPTASCEVDFEVEVPRATFYQITIGSHGGPSYSFEELEAVGFQVNLTL